MKGTIDKYFTVKFEHKVKLATDIPDEPATLMNASFPFVGRYDQLPKLLMEPLTQICKDHDSSDPVHIFNSNDKYMGVEKNLVSIYYLVGPTLIQNTVKGSFDDFERETILTVREDLKNQELIDAFKRFYDTRNIETIDNRYNKLQLKKTY